MAGIRNIFAGAAVAVVVISVVVGIVLLGSPADERMLRFDLRRIDDLERIMRKTDVFWTQNNILPDSLEKLSQEPGMQISIRDPGTGLPYEYRIIGENRYELCAQFERESVIESTRTSSIFWSHGAGRQCFQLEARNLNENRNGYNP